ncbi:MAG: hypothetical protein JHC31_14120 [Sulfurihydrogenibium sp.]|jgi:hypothetical protein|nr:hypothetical protein [Sulfurihydrogenibium sp.]
MVFVDIDNTLWDFGTVFYTKLRLKGYNVPPPHRWDWHFAKGIVPDGEFYQVVREVHNDQINYSPFPYAREFLKNLKEAGYTVIINSHRDRELYRDTRNWLEKHGLIFDDLILTNDKRIHFKNAKFIVDDAPSILEYAVSREIPATGLLFSWNKHLLGKVKLYNTLKQCEEFILGHTKCQA